MKYARIALAILFVAFAFVDIALAGACCEEYPESGQNEASCFCCCTHVIVEHAPNFSAGPPDVPLLQSTATLAPRVFSSAIYHPPRLP